MLAILAQGLTWVLVVVLVLQIALVAYLLLLAAAALVAKCRPVRVTSAKRRRFAVLVPAHNEELVIGRLLSSLEALDYPRDCFDVWVVADNCEDETASIARGFNVRVCERFSNTERAKGFALRWLIERLAGEDRDYDAFVIVDADSIVARDFLQCMNSRLARGARVIQAYYSVLNSHESATAGLRYAALAAVHYLRPLGRSLFGLSCGLKGNGMCFDSAVLREFTWRWFTLAEDVEFHLALVRSGIAVEFAPETWVKADMPVTFKQSVTQHARWEQGRLQLVRRHVPALLRAAIAGRSWLRLDAAIEQLIPPLSVPFALGLGTLAAAAIAGSMPGALAAFVCLVGYATYLLIALLLVGAPWRIYCALPLAPVYIGWKLGIYARSLIGARSAAWVRTARV